MLAGIAVASAAASLLACNKVPTGELGQGEFRYLCAPSQFDTACGDSTLQCDGDQASGATCQLPVAYAVGSRFQIAYAPTTDFGYSTLEQSNYLIVPASLALAKATGNTIVPQRAGWVALLAEQTGLTTVDDFIHIQLATVVKLTPSIDSIAIATGQSQTIFLTPYDGTGTSLAGELECDWTITSGAGCIAWLPNGTHAFGGVVVEGVAPGSGNLHVACGTNAVDVPLTVTGTSTTGSCDGGTGGDGGGDAGGDTGGDAANEGGGNG